MKLKAYLCGPMTGQTVDQCSGWRELAAERLGDLYHCVSPLRGKDYLPPGPLSAFANIENEVGAVLSGAKGILHRDTWDVRRCDITFAIFQDTEIVSIGSVMEIAFAHAFHKPIVAVIDERHRHPFIVEAVTHLCPDYDTAIEVMRRFP